MKNNFIFQPISPDGTPDGTSVSVVRCNCKETKNGCCTSAKCSCRIHGNIVLYFIICILCHRGVFRKVKHRRWMTELDAVNYFRSLMPLSVLLNAVNYFRKKLHLKCLTGLSAPLCHIILCHIHIMYYYIHNEAYLRQYIYSLWKQQFRGGPRN